MRFNTHKITQILLAVFAVILSVGLAYPLFASVSFPSTIVVPGANTFQIADTNYLQGGHMQFTATSGTIGITMRNAITPERRTTGMLVTVTVSPTSTTTLGSTTYRLVSNRPTSIANDSGITACATTTADMVTDGRLDGKPAGVPVGTQYACPQLSDLNWVTVIPTLDSSSVNSYLRIFQDANGNYSIGIGSGASSTSSTGVSSVTVGSLSPLFTTTTGGTPGVNPSFTFTLTTQVANKVFASPDGTGGAPIFRSLVPADISSTSTATSATILIGNTGDGLFHEVALSGDATIATSGALMLKTIPGIAGAYSGLVTGLTIDTSGRVTGIATSTSGGGGGLASVGSTDNSITLTLGGGGTTLDGVLNLANPNTWTGLQGFAVTNTAVSGSVHALEISPIYNQSGSTAANTDLFINRTETAVGSGQQLLIDAQVGGVSKFKVDSAGNITFTGGLNASGTSTLAGTTYTGANAGILYTNSSGTIMSLALPSGSSCQILHGGTTPSFGCVNLATDVGSTILGITNGGLGSSLSGVQVGDILFANSTNSFTNLHIGSQGQILTASGTGASATVLWTDNQGGWATLNGSASAAGWGAITSLTSGINTLTGGTSTTLNQWLYSYFFPATKPTVSLSRTAGITPGTLEVGSAIGMTFSAVITKNTNNIASLAISASGVGTVCNMTGGFSATTTQPCGFSVGLSSGSATITGIVASSTSAISQTNGGSTTWTATVADTSGLSNTGSLSVTYQPKVYAFLSTNTSYLTAATSTVTSAVLAAANGTSCGSITTSTGCYTLTGTIVGQQYNMPASANGYVLYVLMPTGGSTYDSNYSSCYNNTSTPCIKVSSDGTTPTAGDSSWGRRTFTFTNNLGYSQSYALYAYKASSDTVAYTSDLSNYKVKF